MNKPKIFLTIIAVLLAGAVAFTTMRDKMGISHYLSKYKSPHIIPAPPLALPTFQKEAEIFHLEQFGGQVVLVHFFASWCSHCRLEHSVMIEVAKIPGLKIIGVSVKDIPADLQKWLKEAGNPYAVIGLDPQAQAAESWKIEGTPASFLINKRGKIIYQNSGKLTASQIQEELTPLIKKAARW